MSLRDRPLLYLFLEAHDLARQRRFLETDLGLPVIETDPDPKHRHGVVKYDAGSLIVALNLSPATRFAGAASDGLTIALAGGGGLRTDPHGHHYLTGAPTVVALRLTVGDLAAAAAFHRDVLGLAEVARTAATVTFATGTVPIVLEHSARAPDGRAARQDTYLLVFHTSDIRRARADLAARGLAFAGRGLGSKEIGWTVRFTDPAGHRYCLYQPSDEVFTWSSGPAVRQILAGRR